MNVKNHLIKSDAKITEALKKLNDLGKDILTLFVLGEGERMIGILTDGDIRRGFINGLTLENTAGEFANRNFVYLQHNEYNVTDIAELKERSVKVIPVLNSDFRLLRCVNFTRIKTILPFDVVLMAGGKGERLRPLTENTPKPLLKVGDKPIIEHNIDRLIEYGIDHITISVRYLGDMLKDYFTDGSEKNIKINYVTEVEPMGTIGSVSLIEHHEHDVVLVMNSDLLTNIDFEDFFREFMLKDADMCVASIPYQVDIPYAIIETDQERVLSLKEKPTFTYYSNAGIYLIKKSMLSTIPRNAFYNATDFIEALIADNKKVTYYPILSYWLDIGKMDDFHKAQEDIKHIKF